MEFSKDDAVVYENTRINPTYELDATESQNTSENYEELRFDTKQNEGKTVKEENKRDTFQWKEQPKEIKYIIYTLSVMLVILYAIVITLVVVIFLSKNETYGLWTHWSPWSNCDVTCNNGTQTRTRLCSNPSNSDGQPDCTGDSTDSRDCQKRSCDDSAWSSWGSWGSCSESCDGGIKSRSRTCTNPRQSILFQECEGSSQQVVMCNKHSCGDGAWSSWGHWGSCSENCGGGVKSRLRTCTNPKPSLLGKECEGSREQMVLCNKNTCDNGAWSSWGHWGSCSENCGGGVKSRLRNCTNPNPSLLGKECEGSREQVALRNKNTCDNHKVAFLAYGSGTETSSTTIKFPKIQLNSGNSYNSSTGRFTCKISGIYNFAVTLTKPRRDIDQINAYLRINGLDKLQLHSDPSDTGDIDYGSYSLSASGNFHLNTNDYVYVYSVPNNFINDFKTFFTGVLVIPNN